MSTTAVVIGAGIGGLAAAAALVRHVGRVVVLERDLLLNTPECRAGVPQGRHVHGLLGGGLDALSQLVPGFGAALAAAGAVPIRAGLDVRLELPGYDPFPQRDLGWGGYSMSRPLLEHVLRRLVAQQAGIEIRPGCRVRALGAAAHDGDRPAVGAVCFVGPDGAEQTLPADVVVDASGRGALTLDFLRASGLACPEDESIDVDIRYTCAVFTLPQDARRDWKVLTTRPDPESAAPRRAIMFPLEGGRDWILGLGGVDGDSAPTDAEGFLAYAKSLRTPTAYEAIRNAQLRGEIVRFAFPKSFRRHFERLEAFPRGLLAIADAICRINPSFGQGMSIAARQAVLLDRVLASLVQAPDWPGALAPAFFRALGSVLDDPWSVAAQDYAYAHLAAHRPPAFERRAAFLAAVQRLAADDPGVHKVMLEVTQLMRPSSVYQEPDLAGRIAHEMEAGQRAPRRLT